MLSMTRSVAVFVLWLVFATSAPAGQPKPVEDPTKLAEQLSEMIKASDVESLTKEIMAYTGADTSQTAALRGALGYFNGRKALLSDRLFDQWFGTTHRQIVYFLPYSDFAFVYVRYNFKRIDTGWILSNFNFKTELQEILPPGFIAGH